MPGLGAFALAGAVGGLGQAIVDQANKRREDFLAAQRRQQELADQQMAWDRDDRVRAEGWAREDALTAEERARADARVDRGADALEGIFRSGQADPERVRYVADRLVSMGYPPHIAAGLVGNFMQESGTGLDTGAIGDNGAAGGMGQWNGPRLDALQDYAREQGVDWRDLDTQIDFFDLEMRTSESDARDAIMQAQTAEEAARIASERFWRPGIPHIERRQAYAREVFELIADPETPAPVREALIEEVERGTGRGLGASEPIDYEDAGWFPSEDGTTEFFGGINPTTGEVVPIPQDGRTLTRPSRSADRPDEDEGEVSARARVQIEEAAAAVTLPSEYTPVIEEVVLEQVKAGVNEGAAVQNALRGMIFRRTKEGSGGLWGLGATAAVDEEGPYVAGFEGTQVFLGFDLDGDGKVDVDGATGYTAPEGDMDDVAAEEAAAVEVPEFPAAPAPRAAPPADPATPAEPGSLAQPTTQAEYDALPPGTPYIHPDGTRRVKP